MYSVLILDVEEAAIGLTEESREVLDSIALCRSVYDAKHFLQMILDQLGFAI